MTVLEYKTPSFLEPESGNGIACWRKSILVQDHRDPDRPCDLVCLELAAELRLATAFAEQGKIGQALIYEKRHIWIMAGDPQRLYRRNVGASNR